MTYPSGHGAEPDKILGPVDGQPEETLMLQSPLNLPALTSTTVVLRDPVKSQWRLTCLL